MGKMKDKYKKSKAANVGEACICPACSTPFIKESYQQAFCKTKGGTACKDKYWNTVTPSKRNNTTRISPRNAAFMESEKSKDYFNQKRFGVDAPNIIGGSGKVTRITSEGYRVMDGIAYDEFDEPIYDNADDDYDEGDSEYWNNSDNGFEN